MTYCWAALAGGRLDGSLSRASGTSGNMAPIGRDHAVCLFHAFAKQDSGEVGCSTIQYAGDSRRFMPVIAVC